MGIDSKKIAKNTVFLYLRLILVFGVTLYTSRVVLDKLGVTDYGLYYAVYGVIGLLSFLNGTLSIGTSRFITFELGRGNKERLKTTFGTTLITHLLLAGIILILGETLGLWYVHNVLVVPPERMTAALVVYHVSVFTTVLSIIQVPFTSEIMAHEKMDIYAYIGIYEAVFKLVVVFLLVYCGGDRLILYALLHALVVCSIFLVYVIYGKRHFEEVNFRLWFDQGIFSSILKFSGWNVIANMSNMLMTQGVIMLFNLFFSPIVVASRAISNQVSNALMQFVNNVRQAINPQVIKLYADRQYRESQILTFTSAEYVLDLLMLLGVPCIMIMPMLLDLWLVDVPDYAVIFTRFIVLNDILGNFSAAFYIPMVAANRVEKNTSASVLLCVLQFVLLYVLFKCGFDPLWACYLSLGSNCIFSFIVKPYILWKDVGYDVREIYRCIWKCVKKMLAVVILNVAVYKMIPQNSVIQSFVVALLSVIIVVLCSYMYMDKSVKEKVLRFIRNKLGYN